jgi:hypothetical protein
MSEAPQGGESTVEIKPSLARSVIYAITAVAMSVAFLQLARTGETSLVPAILGALVLFVGAAVLLAAHLPGGSLLRLTQDGFEIREFRNSTVYRWTDVSPFGLRRRMLGTSIEFADLAAEGGKPQVRTLPSGYTISIHRLLQLMNEWRDRALTRRE